MATPYEILLRWNSKGEFSGGHEIFQENGVPGAPVPLGTKDHPWPDVLDGINASALAVVESARTAADDCKAACADRDALKAQLDDALASAKATADELTQALADAKKAALDAKESREAAIADLSEQLRIAKLPPSTQRMTELEAQMAQAEKFLAAAKAEHAALLDPA